MGEVEPAFEFTSVEMGEVRLVGLLVWFTCLIMWPDSSLDSVMRVVPVGVALAGCLPMGVGSTGSCRLAVDFVDFMVLTWVSCRDYFVNVSAAPLKVWVCMCFEPLFSCFFSASTIA